MPIRFGTTCGGDFWSPDEIRAVEALGFDGFWTGEHIIYPCAYGPPFRVIEYLAQYVEASD